MARIAGIQIEKDRKGNPAYARINLKKYSQFIEPLTSIGAVEEDEFDRLWKEGITGDELMSRLKPRIKKLFEK